MKYFLLLLFFIFTSFADEVDERRVKIIQVINEELVEVSKLSDQRNDRDPDLLLRMAELNLEKARLYREDENERFLKVEPSKRSKINQSSFFAKSSTYFSQANKLCLQITRKFPRYSKLADVYYILGFNAKEANKQKLAAKYLSRSNKNAKDSQTKVKAQISLAEIYYNAKKYNRSIPLYESALSKKTDKWWTKDSFNLAWSYFRVNAYSKAITLMEEVFEVSSDQRFIDMRPQVERDIGLFYATADRIDDGISFYKKIGINFSDQLLRIAVALLNQGKFDFANKVLAQAEKYEKNEKRKVEIYLEQLNLFERFGKYSFHLRVSKTLEGSFSKNLLSDNQLKNYIFQMEKVAAIVQRQVVSKTYVRLKKQRKLKAKMVINYYDLLVKVNLGKTEEYRFIQGETAFVVKDYNNSYRYYKGAFEFGRKDKKSKFLRKSMDGMLVSIGKLKGSTDKNIYVFESYLSLWPNDKLAKDIYQRLFNNYMTLGKTKEAKNVLDRFVKYYPKDPIQEAMIAKLMDSARDRKDNNEVRTWISLIGAGNYLVSSKFKNKLQELLTTMQMEDVQKELTSGSKLKALQGYLSLLKDPYSTKKSRINAKYNLAALYYELGDISNSYKWGLEALKEMKSSDVLKFSASFVSISNFLFNSFEYNKSADLSYHQLEKICLTKSKTKNIIFKNGAFISLAEGDVVLAEKYISLGRRCSISRKLVDEVEYEVMREYLARKDWGKYELFVNKNQDSLYYYNRVIDDLLNLVNIHKQFDNQAKVKKYQKLIGKLYYRAKKQRKVLSVRVLDFFAEVELIKIRKLVSKKNLVKFSTLDTFQKNYDLKFSYLQQIENNAQKVIQVGSGKGIVEIYKILYENYLEFANELSTVVPTGLKPEFIPNFRKDLASPIKATTLAAQTYKMEASKAIKNNSILNQNNFYFQDGKYPVKYFNSDSVYMDRSGVY